MLFENVVMAHVAHVDAPHRIDSNEFEDRLSPFYARLGLRPGLLKQLAGIEARRWWEPGVKPSDAATLAGQKLLEEVSIERDRIGLLINTSVCRDYLEPSTACVVHGNLGLSTRCRNFDLGNACLAFLNAIDMVALQLERGLIDYGMIVDGETSREIQEATLERMLSPEMTELQFRKEFASLTLGSGGVAMLLTRRELAPDAPTVRGGVMRAATEHRRLCWGHARQMETDTKALLSAGVSLAQETWTETQSTLGWNSETLDHLILHQVSAVHTETICQTLRLDSKKAFLIYPEFGNVGPAAVPMTLSKAHEAGRIKNGQRVALMGIGSGLNCAMYEISW